MKCEEIQKKLSAYQDNELGQKETELVRRHLSECRACAEELRALNSAWDFLQTAEVTEPAPYLWTRLSARIAAQGEQRGFISKLWKKLIANPVPAFTAAALVLGLLFGNFVGRTLYPNGYHTNGETTAEALAINSFDDMPSGSLSEAYYSLLSEGGER
jgi:predicted anti-sigma-YlaC factor YlaD